MIKIKELTKVYKKKYTALQHVDLEIGTGMFGLLGPNGAGKTTLMRILATLLHPSSGEVEIEGFSLTKQPEKIREIIGYLPQHFQIYPQLTAIEFLDYVAVMKGIENKHERKQVVQQILEEVNLVEKAKKKVKTYSGGMKQRLGIAQALLGNPKVLIVDEPTAGLDPEERVRFRNLLARLSIDRTIILSTHIVADIENSCNQLAVLDHGMLAMTGSLDELQAKAEGKVWEVTVTDGEYQRLAHLQIVSTRRTTEGIQCRIISDEKPTEEATLVSPTLEDGYLALIGGKHHE